MLFVFLHAGVRIGVGFRRRRQHGQHRRCRRRWMKCFTTTSTGSENPGILTPLGSVHGCIYASFGTSGEFAEPSEASIAIHPRSPLLQSPDHAAEDSQHRHQLHQQSRGHVLTIDTIEDQARPRKRSRTKSDPNPAPTYSILYRCGQ
ncbi:PREDICTED: uncharacterized protein LOC106818650 [Priapulus caudatus]|uniref:Uncharacterized protein LOC106818650 n=1 Tax=Priapulus caudatus TaxID=37621 RepID=A0ABM1F303_PRICU|nr:PREDICTED: uncharacterized protein LOC106818650 [Priapulus caudatus]